jgi:carbon storage regulator
VDVHREEVYLELQRANRAAASPDAASVEALKTLVAQPADPPGA